MTAGAHDEFDLALVETQYRDAIRSLVAATGLAATYQDERDKALAALARVEAVGAKWATKRDELWRPIPWRSVYGAFADDIRAAIEGKP